jgi:hypothetical protein
MDYDKTTLYVFILTQIVIFMGLGAYLWVFENRDEMGEEEEWVDSFEREDVESLLPRLP